MVLKTDPIPENRVLFDRAIDPEENQNIANTLQAQPIAQKMFAKIDSLWKEETKWPGGK